MGNDAIYKEITGVHGPYDSLDEYKEILREGSSGKKARRGDRIFILKYW